jgi:hypothetical protein
MWYNALRQAQARKTGVLASSPGLANTLAWKAALIIKHTL